jgi:hypothetical protein
MDHAADVGLQGKFAALTEALRKAQERIWCRQLALEL